MSRSLLKKLTNQRLGALLLLTLLTATTAWATDVTLSGSDNYTAQNGDVLTGSTSGTVTIAEDASITLNNATITGGIVCEGTATITLVGTNSVSGATDKAGIQVGDYETTLTIKGNGSLTANGGDDSAGIGLGRAWNVNASGGNIVIEGGNITANGNGSGAGIGTGLCWGGSSDKYSFISNITIKGGTVKAIGGTDDCYPGNGIGKGGAYAKGHTDVYTITIYDDVDMVDASSISEDVTFMHGNNEVTDNKTDYFSIGEDGDRRIITKKDNTDYTITIADGIEHGTITTPATARYLETVTVNVTPAFGYHFVRLIVKDSQNNDVASAYNTFLMPKGNVTVSAEFAIGSRGTKEFLWAYSGDFELIREPIYDGVTTVNIQQRDKSYHIRDNGGTKEFLLDNNTYSENIPYASGTGAFTSGTGTYFNLSNDAETGYYDITLNKGVNDKWSVSIQKTVGKMDIVPDQTYTGSAITPEPMVIAGSLSLTKGTDYTYSYENNTNAGTATVRATFHGDYAWLGNVEQTFTIVDPRISTSYVDADGTEHTNVLAIPLDETMTTLAAGTYVVNSNITYTSTVNLTGNVNLILADGCTMNVGTSESRIDGKGIARQNNGNQSLTIFGQTEGTGALNIYTGNNAIIAYAVTINGGNVTVSADGQLSTGINAKGTNLTINGGMVNATATGDYTMALTAEGNITINGGTVNANGETYGIASNHGTITLGWNKPADRICITANSYNGTVNVAEGKSLYNGVDKVLSGTITDISDINGKTLVPAYKVNFTDVEHGTVVADKSFVTADAEDKTVTLTITPDTYYCIESLTVTDASSNTVTVNNNTFTMPASDVTVSATFTKIIASVIVGENETYYGSFSVAETAAKAAYVAAQGETAAVVPTLKLYDDVDYGANSLQLGNGTDAFEMTFDLNGHRFYGDGAECVNVGSNLIYIAPNAKLTVIDTSTGDTKGSIDCTINYKTGIFNSGTLALNGGTIKYSGVQGTVVDNNGGSLTLNGSTISGGNVDNGSTGIENGFTQQKYGICNIVNGSIEDCDKAINNFAILNMSGGVITNCRYGIDINFSNANTLNISGGTISNCSEEGIMLGRQGILNMTALPAFSDNAVDIAIYDEKKVNFNEGTYAIPTSPIKIKVDYDGTDPYVFTEGYSANVKRGNSVIAFNDVFNVTIQNKAENATFSFVGEGVIAAPKTFSFAESQVWSTWCDMYEWTIPEGVEVYEVTGVSNRNVGIQQLSATAIPAYKPVLLKKKDSGSLEATIAGIGTAPESYDSRVGVVTTTVGDATIVGATRQTMEWDVNDYFTKAKTYMLHNNEFVLIDYSDGLAAHKFWINMDIDGADTKVYCSRSMSIGGDGTTSLREVNSGEVNSEEWFSLDGRKLEGKPTKKGLYIHNGKKIVIK